MEKEKHGFDKELGLDLDFDEPIVGFERDTSPEAKQKAFEELMEFDVNPKMDIYEFERRVHCLFDLVFLEFSTYCLFERCIDKFEIDDEFIIQPDFTKFTAPQLLWIVDSISHIDRRNDYLLMPYLLKTKYIQNLMVELKKKKDHIFDEVAEDFFERG